MDAEGYLNILPLYSILHIFPKPADSQCDYISVVRLLLLHVDGAIN